MAKQNRRQDVKKEVSLGARQREYALIASLRNIDVFNSAKDRLHHAVFNSLGVGYPILWATLTDYVDTHKTLPTKEILIAELENRLNVIDSDVMTEDDVAQLDEFVEVAFGMDLAEISLPVALSYVGRMMSEYAQETLVRDMSGGIIANYPEFLAQQKQIAEAALSVVSGAAPVPFPENPEEITPVILEPTGVSFLDIFMNGGMARGEVNGFCGPYGSCKTTLGIQLAVEGARLALSRWRENGQQGQPERVYYFSWEEDVKQLQPRVVSYAGYISRASLEGKDFVERLSKSTLSSLKDYEKQHFREQISAGVIIGEYDRMRNAMSELNQNLRIIDFTGHDVNYRDLTGRLIDGVALAINRDQQYSNNPGVALVIIDYAGAAVEYAVMAGNIRREEMRHHLGHLPLSLKNLVAAPMNCQVWCLHQLGTAAQALNSGVAPKTTDAAEARNFFENVNFGFMVGKPTRENMTVLTNGKQRRATRREDIVVHIAGEFSRVDDASRRFTISDDGIVDRASANEVVRVENRVGNPRNTIREIGL
jgi:hypothetical protein